MGEATQATQSLPDFDSAEEETPKEKVWGRLVSLNPIYDNVELTGVEVVLGRQSCCHVQIQNNLNISGKHCRIFREPSANGSIIAFVQDMSTNGTFVNGNKLGKGNRLLLGNGHEIALVLNKKKSQEKVAYIFQECAEDKPQEEGGPQKKYDIRDALGAGNFAVVKLAINKATGGRFAIKIIDKKKYLSQAGSRKEALMDEVTILRSLNHPHIIHIEEIFDTEKTLYLVLELVEGGDLFGDIAREGHYNEEKARDVFGQIIDAIYFLHNQGIAHRDLKPENILLKTKVEDDKDIFDVKLSDFGLSRTIGEGSFMKTMCGTPQYLAPEIITSGGMDGYGKEVDMWSAGAILYVLLCGFPPFDDTKSISIFDQIKQGLVDFPDAAWGSVSASAKDLIKRLLTVEPSRRYTALQTKDHPWMKGESTVPADMEPPVTGPQTPFPTPSKPKPIINPNNTPAPKINKNNDNDADYGSVINYNKTTEEKNKVTTTPLVTPPSTPTTNSTTSTPSTTANSPASNISTSSSYISTSISVSPNSSFTHPTSTSTSELKTSNGIKNKDTNGASSPSDSNNNNEDDKNNTGITKAKSTLVSMESEKNLQTQFEKVGLEKRKRDQEKEEDEDATDEDEALKVPPPPKLKSGNSILNAPPSPPATKKLKKSATADLGKSFNHDASDDEEEEKNGKTKKPTLKASNSDQQLLSKAKKDNKPPLKQQNSFNGSQGDDDEDEDEENNKGNKKKKDARPMCMYGKNCYRKNPLHFKEFQHP